MILIPCEPCRGTGRGPCMACGGAAVVAEAPTAGLWWPGIEPTVDAAEDYAYDRERDAQIGVC